jgi:hypothetical protein
MDLEEKRRELQELEKSLVRIDRVIFRQGEIVAELERDGHELPAKLARSLLREFEKSYNLHLARRDWLRKQLGRYAR